MLRKQIQGGTCPTCHQELPPPDGSTRQALAEAEADLQGLKDASGDGPDLGLERRIRALIDTTTSRTYQEKQERLNKLAAVQFERSRRLSALKEAVRPCRIADGEIIFGTGQAENSTNLPAAFRVRCDPPQNFSGFHQTKR